MGDLVAFVGCLLGLGLVLLLAVHARGTAQGVTQDVQAAAAQAAPTLLQLPLLVFGVFVMSLAPLAVLGELAFRRQWRILATAVGAFVVGLLLTDVVTQLLLRADPQLLHWLTDPGVRHLGPSLAAALGEEQPGWLDPQVTATAAMLVATGARSRSRIVRGTWWLLAAVLVLSVIEAQAAPMGTVFVVVLGVALGLAARYATGGYANRSWGSDLVRTLLRAGVDVQCVVRVDVPQTAVLEQASVTTYAGVGYLDSQPDPPPRRDEYIPERRLSPGDAQLPAGCLTLADPATPPPPSSHRRYVVTSRDGTQREAVVLDADRQVVSVLRAAWDRLRLTGSVRRPVASVDAAADRLALLALAAQDAGVRTPALRGIARSGDSVVVVFDQVTGARPLAVLAADTPNPSETDAIGTLDDVWRQVRAAHAVGLAHLDLSADTVLVDPDGQVWLTGWFEGQVGCSDFLRRIDLVQVLALSAVLLGPTQALQVAGRNLSEAELTMIAPLLQSPVLPGATRKAATNLRNLLSSLREQLVGMVPAADVEPVQLSRFSVKSVITATILVVAAWTVLTTMNFAEISQAISGASPWWVLAAFGIQLLSYWGGAVTLAAYTPERIGVWAATEVHMASSVVDLVAPAAIGGATVNLRFLNRRGVSTPLGLASVALVQISQIVITVLLLVVVALGTGFALPSARPSREVLLAILGVSLLLGGALAVPRVRDWVGARLGPALAQARPRVAWLLSHPQRMALGIVGNLVMTLSYVGAMAACVAAFGESLPLSTLAITYLASNSAGSAVPTPGGIGPIEAALTAGLTVAGISPALALSIALVFRFVTLWVNVPIGWFYFRRLQRKNLL